MSADVTSSALDTSSMVSVSVQAAVTGTCAGTIKMQASNDAASPVNWSDIANATVSVSNTGVYFIPKQDISYQYIRIVYTRTSGSGTLVARVKTVGY